MPVRIMLGDVISLPQEKNQVNQSKNQDLEDIFLRVGVNRKKWPP